MRAFGVRVLKAGSRRARRFTSIRRRKPRRQNFLRKFWKGTGILSGDARLRRARPESRFAPCKALHFDSQTKATQVAFFLSNFFWTKKIGQNWNRTSDTRIFRPAKSVPAISLDDLKSTNSRKVYREKQI